jgi:hypothetical protein
MHDDFKHIENSNSYFFDLLHIKGNFIEVSHEFIYNLGEEFGVDGYERYFKGYDKVIISCQTEGHGLYENTKYFIENYNKDKIFIINDGFICEEYVESIFKLPREQIFIEPTLNIWWNWNFILGDNGYNRFRGSRNVKSSKINNGFRRLHNNDLSYFKFNFNVQRDHKFIILGNNYKEGRPQLIDTLREVFIMNNWVSANFLQDKLLGVKYSKPYPPVKTELNKLRKYIRRDDYDDYENDDTGWNSCYEIIWKEHKDKAYIQPYWESSTWTDAITDGHYILTEKSLIPMLLGNISIPLGIFYVDYLEKLGYEFVKEIGDVPVNKKISQKEFWDIYLKDKDNPLGDSRLDERVYYWNYKLFNKLNLIDELYERSDIKEIYHSNKKILEHNLSLVKTHMEDESCLIKLKKWIEQ